MTKTQETKLNYGKSVKVSNVHAGFKLKKEFELKNPETTLSLFFVDEVESNKKYINVQK